MNYKVGFILPVGIGFRDWLVFCKLVWGSEVGSYFASWCGIQRLARILQVGVKSTVIRRGGTVQCKRRGEMRETV